MGVNGNYRTSDLWITAWLLSNGLELRGIDRRNPRRCEFVFADRSDRLELVQTFVYGSATGNLVDFIFHLRKAKRLLYSGEV